MLDIHGLLVLVQEASSKSTVESRVQSPKMFRIHQSGSLPGAPLRNVTACEGDKSSRLFTHWLQGRSRLHDIVDTIHSW